MVVKQLNCVETICLSILAVNKKILWRAPEYFLLGAFDVFAGVGVHDHVFAFV